LKLYADEGVDRPIVIALRAAGIDVAYAAESEPATLDEVLLQKAVAEERLLVTTDKDFGEIVFRLGKASKGVLLIRLSGLSADHKAQLVLDAVKSQGEQLAGSFSVLSPGQLRIRTPHVRG
jgi:predicted nuclease of predicted toxin-antitoxin system